MLSYVDKYLCFADQCVPDQQYRENNISEQHVRVNCQDCSTAIMVSALSHMRSSTIEQQLVVISMRTADRSAVYDSLQHLSNNARQAAGWY
jgi:hypothetical protein